MESHISDPNPGQFRAEVSEKPTLDNIVGIHEVDYIMDKLMGIHEYGYGYGCGYANEDELRMALIGQLFGYPCRRVVISIVGMGGLGKTTLARRIFLDKPIHEHFDRNIWVTVSQDYNVQDILVAIINTLRINKKELHGAGKQIIQEHIYKHLFGRRYLIILDDVWDKKVWDDIKRILPDKNNGSRIMITTRQSDVASHANTSEFCHRMPFLDEHRSWNLFCEKVICPPELEDIGRLIAKNCRGLPLAIVVVAGLLSKVKGNRHYWEEIARNVTSATIRDENFAKILFLSYRNLPHHLKPCFLYLGGFPKDYEIPISILIWLWAAEGFLEPNAYKNSEEIGEEYLLDLASRNLVLLTKKRSNGKLKYCLIHDFLKEFCIQRAHRENFLLLHEHDVSGNVRHLYVHSSSYFQDSEENCAPHVCSVLSPIEIVELSHLRFLALKCFECHIPPSISKLQNLQTLIICGIGTSSLPSEIWKMPQLRHVIFSRTTLHPIPCGERITNGVPLLGKLQTLCTVVDFTFTRDTVEMIPNLKKLKLRFCDYKLHENAWEKFGLKNLIHLHQLETLSIIFDGFPQDSRSFPESFAFPQNLKILTLKGCNLAWKEMTIVGSLPNLQVLKLEWMSFVGEEWETIEGEFLNLKFLRMDGLSDLKYWRTELTHFPRLEQLQVRECKNLEEIAREIGDISTLQLIEVCACSRGLESSVLHILEEQSDMGNDDLLVRVDRNGKPVTGEKHGGVSGSRSAETKLGFPD